MAVDFFLALHNVYFAGVSLTTFEVSAAVPPKSQIQDDNHHESKSPACRRLLHHEEDHSAFVGRSRRGIADGGRRRGGSRAGSKWAVRPGAHRLEPAQQDRVGGCARSCHLDPNLPIIMITTEAEKGRISQAIEAGVSDYIVKPFDREKLRGEARGQSEQTTGCLDAGMAPRIRFSAERRRDAGMGDPAALAALRKNGGRRLRRLAVRRRTARGPRHVHPLARTILFRCLSGDFPGHTRATRPAAPVAPAAKRRKKRGPQLDFTTYVSLAAASWRGRFRPRFTTAVIGTPLCRLQRIPNESRAYRSVS